MSIKPDKEPRHQSLYRTELKADIYRYQLFRCILAAFLIGSVVVGLDLLSGDPQLIKMVSDNVGGTYTDVWNLLQDFHRLGLPYQVMGVAEIAIVGGVSGLANVALSELVRVKKAKLER